MLLCFLTFLFVFTLQTSAEFTVIYAMLYQDHVKPNQWSIKHEKQRI